MGIRSGEFFSGATGSRQEELRLEQMRLALRNDMCASWSEDQRPEVNSRLNAESALVSAYSALLQMQDELTDNVNWQYESAEEIKETLWQTFEAVANNDNAAYQNAFTFARAAHAYTEAHQAQKVAGNRDSKRTSLGVGPSNAAKKYEHS